MYPLSPHQSHDSHESLPLGIEDLARKLEKSEHHFLRKPNGKSIQEREKTTKNEKIAKSDQKVA